MVLSRSVHSERYIKRAATTTFTPALAVAALYIYRSGYTATVSTATIFQCYNGIDRLADFNDGFDCENALLLIV